jgi:drug/metabolite transporter (DMT)-like permease
MYVFIPELVAVACSMSYAASNIAARLGMRHSNPVTMTLVSFTTQTVVLGAYVLVSGNRPPLSYFPAILFVGIGLIMPLIRILTYTGVSTLGASRSAALRSSHPLFGSLFAIFVLREEPTPVVLTGTLLVVAGTFLISWQSDGSATAKGWWYALFPLSAGALTGLVQPVVRYGLRSSDYAIFFTALVGATSLTFSLTLLPVVKKYQRPVWGMRAVKGLIVASLFENLGFVLFIASFGLAPVATVSPIIASSPMWIVIAGLVIFRRRLGWQTVLGTALTVFGTIAIALGR